MAHKTDAFGEYPLPAEVVRFIYDYYFDAPEILAADEEFYALCVDGTLHVCPRYAEPFTYTDIESIASNDLDPGAMGDGLSACVVITRSGNVFTRGKVRGGGKLDLLAQNAIKASRDRDAYPTSVYHTSRTFAILFSNGDQVSWGDTDCWQPNLGNLDLSEVDTLFANKSWFAALMKDKTVQTWPAKDAPLQYQTKTDSDEMKGVVRIYSTWGAFAALRGDGTVVTWGDMRCGGYVKERLTDVKCIFNTFGAFAALKEGGTVVTWGDSHDGGDSSDVSKELEKVEDICATWTAFAARCHNGSVVTWGGGHDGGGVVAKVPPVIEIYSTFQFVARTLDNRFVTWTHTHACPDISYPVQEALGSRHITQLFTNKGTFTVIADATAFTPNALWSGIDVTDIGSRPPIRVVSQGAYFLATIDTGDVVAWGQDRIRFVDRGYADIINQHQRSIRVAFKTVMGMK